MENFVSYIEGHPRLFPFLILFIFIPIPLLCFCFNKFQFNISSFREQDTLKKKILHIFCFILTPLLVFIPVATLSLLTTYLRQVDPTPIVPVEELSEKIERISNELSTSSKELLDIQSELESRIEVVESLKKEAEIAENVISLTSDQVNAIQSKLNQELAANDGKNVLTSVIINAVFFALGLTVQPISQFIKNKNTKQNLDSEKNKKNSYSEEEIHQIANQVADQVAELLRTEDHTS